jgi:hypothetical protein
LQFVTVFVHPSFVLLSDLARLVLWHALLFCQNKASVNLLRTAAL